jgi:hypothetical protein
MSKRKKKNGGYSFRPSQSRERGVSLVKANFPTATTFLFQPDTPNSMLYKSDKNAVYIVIAWIEQGVFRNELSLCSVC